jgi:ubiquinol-cytochrome c reductase cytochrome c subunit
VFASLLPVSVVGLTALLLWRAPPAATTPHAPAAPDAPAIYLRDCAVCHGSDARGTNRGPTLIGVGRASVDFWVSTGRMPLEHAVGRDPVSRAQQPLPAEQLGDPEATTSRHHAAYPRPVIDALVDYVAGLAGGGPDIPLVHPAAGDVSVGGELFRLQCASCHAWAGDGGALLNREAPSLHDATVTQIAEAIRTGPGTMPPFGPAALDDHQLDSLVAYVRYLDAPRDRGGQPLWHLGPVAEGAIAWLFGLGLLLVVLRWMGTEVGQGD